jgi:phosphatidate phosphatase PAH1
VGDYTNVSQAQDYAYSEELVYLYKSKGYMVIFLTARPYWVARDTREWYSVRDYPETTVTHFDLSNEEGMDAAQYKTEYLNYLKNSASVSLIRAYGNATSDIEAYNNAGIPKSETYIIGSNAGASGTKPINTDYKNHYNWVKTILDCCDH